MSVVSNYSPLIWLSKIGWATLLVGLLIPEEVYTEVVERGLKEGSSEALVVKECIDQGWIRTAKLNREGNNLCQKIMEHTNEIHLGEAQAILLEREKDTLLLTDEAVGRALAESWGIQTRGTLYIILRALKKRLLTKDEAKKAVQLLVNKGFRLESKLLVRIMKRLEAFS